MIRAMAVRLLEGCRWTVVLATAALAVHAAALVVPGGGRLAELLTFEREAILAGQIWRVLGGHLAHFTIEQLVWNVVVFVALGCLCEKKLGAAYLPSLAGSALLVSVGMLLLDSGIRRYRGLSGVASALFTVTMVFAIAGAVRSRRLLLVGLSLAGTALFAGKVLHETLSGSAVFSRDLATAGVVPVPLAHVLGGIAGALIGLAGMRSPSPPYSPARRDGLTLTR